MPTDPPADADPVADFLRKTPTTNLQRREAWQAFEDSSNADVLADRLKAMTIPREVKRGLWELKEAAAPMPVTEIAAPEYEPAAPAPSLAERAGQWAKDTTIGNLKGLGSTVFGLGKMVRDYTPIGRISDVIHPDAFEQKPAELVPTNTAQKVGYGAEQIGEFFLPTGVAGAAGKLPKLAAEVGKGGVLTLAQGGTPTTAGVSMGLSAAAPAVGAGLKAVQGPVVQALETSAAKKVMQALGPTKERYKAIAERLTPEILRRGLRGSRETLQAKAAETLDDVGQQLDTVLATFGTQPVNPAPVTAALETAKDAFRTTNAAGALVEFEPRAIRQLDGLQKIVTDIGPDATVDQLVAVRRAWDKVVDQAGGFAHRAGGAIGVPLKDQSEAWAKREATGAIRKLLATEVPDLAAINKEWAFWKNLDDVLTKTMQRTQPHGPGLLKQGAEAAGQVVGAVSGSGVAGKLGGAWALGKLSKFAQSTFTSPRWRLASAQTKDALASAIASNDPQKIATALGKISASVPARVGQ